MVNVVVANVINASLNSYAAISGSAPNPGYSFIDAPSTGIFNNTDSIALSYQGNSVLHANDSGIYSNTVHANVDGSYLTGNIDAEVVIVEGAIDLSTDVVGVLPQQSLPARIGNVDTLFLGNSGTVDRPVYSFAESNSSGLYGYGQGNVGLSVNGTPTLTVHSNGITVNGFVEGYLVSNASQLTTGTIDNSRMPNTIHINSFVGNVAQFEHVQSQHIQSDALMTRKCTTETIESQHLRAHNIAAPRIEGAFFGEGEGLTLNAATILQGTLDNARLSSFVHVNHLSANTLEGDAHLLTNIQTHALYGNVSNDQLPREIQLSHIQANAVQTENLQALGLTAHNAHMSQACIDTLHTSNFIGSGAQIHGAFEGTFEGASRGEHVGNFSGDGSNLSNISASGISHGILRTSVLPSNILVERIQANTFVGNGHAITDIDATQVRHGTLHTDVLPDALKSNSIQSTSAQFAHVQTSNLQSRNMYTDTLHSPAATIDSITAGDIVSNNISGTISGTVTGMVSGNVSGNGTGLTIDASNISVGTLPNDRLSACVFVHAITSEAYYGNASGLSQIHASNITSGTIDTNILPETVIVESVHSNTSRVESTVSNATQSLAGQFHGVQAQDAQFFQCRSETAFFGSIESSTIASNTVLADHVAVSSSTYLKSSQEHQLNVVSNNNTVATFSDTFSSLGKCTQYKDGALVLNASDDCVDPLTPGIYAKPIRGTPASTPVMTYNAVTGEINYNVSTQKTKENIVDLGKDTSSIYKLQPREFDAIETGEHHVGFIAEEAFEADPAFTWSQGGAVQGLDWFAMLTYVIAEIQHLRSLVTNRGI